MGDKTSITWTGATWNPWTGCTKVSQGCKYCYMYREKTRYRQDPADVMRSKTTFCAPLHWKEPRLIFTCSWSDFFHKDADAWREEAWSIIERTPQHTYQILTKRPERMHAFLKGRQVLPNVWLGVSVENQEMASERLPWLFKTPARLRFLSVEPLLAPVDLCEALGIWWHQGKQQFMYDPWTRRTDWVIVGGESGPNPRPMQLKWLTSIVEQCQAAGVPVFVKQDSAFKAGQQGRIPDEIWALKQFPEEVSA